MGGKLSGFFVFAGGFADGDDGGGSGGNDGDDEVDWEGGVSGFWGIGWKAWLVWHVGFSSWSDGVGLVEEAADAGEDGDAYGKRDGDGGSSSGNGSESEGACTKNDSFGGDGSKEGTCACGDDGASWADFIGAGDGFGDGVGGVAELNGFYDVHGFFLWLGWRGDCCGRFGFGGVR